MKHILASPFLIGMLVVFPLPKVFAETVTLSNMVKSVQIALRDAQKHIRDNGLPTLDRVTLNLKTVVKKEQGAAFTVYVVSIGGSGATQVTSSVTLELVPPSPDAPSDVSQADAIHEGLLAPIIAAAEAVRAAQEGEPRLNADSINVDLAFVLESREDGGIKILFPPFEVSAAGNITRSEIQTISIRLK